ncbi:UNVERIFIED_CONTAM: hypothetical protein Scaly_1615800 [Sesamum calycinum]|uniref:DDE Tnp4 domain-containing protein n=1 Tax=Sesamum calycinum TaxID=2727403 RepID=A0AAW2PCH7_9LAMI
MNAKIHIGVGLRAVTETEREKSSTNVLRLCNIEGKFIYIFEWEGRAADGRVLRDVVHRPTGIKVPTGNYYLCDNGYGNVGGFLTPYLGVRYHLKEWDRSTRGPQSPQELFNLRHASARNMIEQTFGLLKTRWGILRSPPYYLIRVQNQIIVAYCLLHNFIRMEMPDAPLELELPDEVDTSNDHIIDFMSTLDATPQWTSWRDELATNMYTEWICRR